MNSHSGRCHHNNTVNATAATANRASTTGTSARHPPHDTNRRRSKSRHLISPAHTANAATHNAGSIPYDGTFHVTTIGIPT